MYRLLFTWEKLRPAGHPGQGTCVCMAINVEARSRSLYLYAKSLVHRINRNEVRSHWLSALVFVNDSLAWCSYSDLMNIYKTLFMTRDLNPSGVDIEHYVCRIDIHEFNIHTNVG